MSASLTAKEVLDQVAALLANEAFQAVSPVVNSTLADIVANPQEWLNPASAAPKGAAALANIIAALPTFENEAVPSAANLVKELWTQIGAKLAAASGSGTSGLAAMFAQPAAPAAPAPVAPAPVAPAA